MKHLLFVLLVAVGCKKIESAPSSEYTRINSDDFTNVGIFVVERAGLCFAVAVTGSAVAMVQVPCEARVQPPAEAAAAAVPAEAPAESAAP